MEIRVKESILVLSAELIMFIGRLQEILELTSRAMALLQLQKLNVGQFALSVDKSNYLVINPTDLTPPLLSKITPFSQKWRRQDQLPETHFKIKLIIQAHKLFSYKLKSQTTETTQLLTNEPSRTSYACTHACMHEVWVLTDINCLTPMQVYLPGITTSTQGESGRLVLILVTRIQI